jgi:hypothetical protein
MSDCLLGIIMQRLCSARPTARKFRSLPSMDLGAYLATSNITDAIILQSLHICFEQSTKQRFNGPRPSYGDLLSVNTPKRLHINHGTASWTGIA